MKFQKNSLKKNYIYNLAYNLLVLITPLITTPYLSRVLLPHGIGVYSFTYSLVNYFIIIASLGFIIYGQREISKLNLNIHKISLFFWEIFLLRIFTVFISMLLYVLLIYINILDGYNLLMIGWLFILFAQIFDITFLFQGIERFDIILIRNIILKVLSMFLVFVIVNKPNDVLYYILIVSAGTLLSNLSSWFSIKGIIQPTKFNKLKPFRHFYKSLILLIPTISVNLYSIIDKTMIGFLVKGSVLDLNSETQMFLKLSDIENGYYEQSLKFTLIGINLVTILATVIVPKNANLISNGEISKFKNNIYLSNKYIWFVGVPIMVGILTISSNVVPWFFGDSFIKVTLLLRFFSPLILLIGLNNLFGMQYLIPMGKDSLYNRIIFVGLILNIVFNFILIPKLFSIGAVISSIITEIFISIFMFISLKKVISFKKIFQESLKYLLAGLFMLLILILIQSRLMSNLYNSILLISIGIFVYLLILLLIKEFFTYSYFQKFKKLLIKSHKGN